MTQGLRALLEGAIDYAGLFPPARLSLEETVRNYAQYARSGDAWMLGRLIVPAAKLEALLPLIDPSFTNAQPLRISVLLGGGESKEEFLKQLAVETVALGEFRQAVNKRAVIDVAEVKLPREVETPTISSAKRFLEEAKLRIFFECSLAQLQAVPYETGVKFRTGGVEASAFPSPQMLAQCIWTARTRRCPMKFTAGLHHPIRLFHSSVNTRMFGFVNVLAGAMLAESESDLVRLLECEDPSQVRINHRGIQMLDRFIPTREIEKQRSLVTSFGSCSFDEPREDLRALSWL